MVFSVGLEYFFNPEARPVLEIVRKKDRLRFPETPEVKDPTFWFESLDFPVPNRALDSYYAEFEAAEGFQLHEHPGVELLYVMTGRLELAVGGARHDLDAGDAIYFDATSPHGFRRLGA
jgi:quercetin dioxygenase-like cupin family protein